MASKLEIVNKSFRLLGVDTITQAELDAGSNEQARIMNDIYDIILNEVLISHPYNFAIKRATLTEIGGEVETWTAEGTTNVWEAALTTEPSSVRFDGTEGTEVASVAAITTANYWFWESDVLYVYSTSDPDTAFTSPGIEAIIPEFEFDHAFSLPSDYLRAIRTDEDDAVFVIEGTRLLTNDSSVKLQYIASITTATLFPPGFIMEFAQKLAAEMTIPTTNSPKLAVQAYELYILKRREARAIDAQEGTGREIDESSWEKSRE